MGATISGIALILMLAVYFFAFLISIAIYVLNGIGMMKLAKSCGLSRTWMAFVPFASTYQLGQVAECAAEPGKKKLPLRHFALIGHITIAILVIGYYIWFFMRMFAMGLMEKEMSAFDLFSIVGGAAGFTALLGLLSLALSVLIYYIYWKIFRLFIPQYAVIFLLLTIFLNIQPILLFAIRNRAPQFPTVQPTDDWN